VHSLAGPSSARVHLQLLGAFALIHDEAVVAVRGGGQRLLALLSTIRGPMTRAQASGVLWPDSTSGRASTSLRATLSRLPRPGGMTLITSSSTGLALNESVEVDVWQCEAEVRRLRSLSGSPAPSQEWSERTHALLGSDLLPLWDEDWVLVQRERHRQARLHALERLSTTLCLAGRWEEALQAGLAAVAGEPLRESAHQRVIEVHLAEGNPAEALRQYGIYRRILREELGLRPSETLRQLLRPFLGRPGAVTP
jgi:DNA-binding SARP family transcriptional activator